MKPVQTQLLDANLGYDSSDDSDFQVEDASDGGSSGSLESDGDGTVSPKDGSPCESECGVDGDGEGDRTNSSSDSTLKEIVVKSQDGHENAPKVACQSEKYTTALEKVLRLHYLLATLFTF